MQSEYRKNPAINQSMLVALSKGVGSYKFEQGGFESTAFTIGNAVDCLLTTPEEFDARFYVSSINFSSGSAAILKKVYDNTEFPMGINTHQVEILEEATVNGLGNGNWSEERMWKHILKSEEVWNELCISKDLTIISKAQLPIIDRCVNTLKNHPFSKDIIAADGEYQKAIYFKHKDLDCKALLDKVIFLKDNIIQPFDLKTTGESVKMWGKSFRRFRYDVQAAWYMLALHKEYPNATILPMQFVVISTSTKEHPLIYKTTRDNLFIGKFGATKEYTEVIPNYKYIENTHILGYEQMIDKYNLQMTLPIELQKKYDYHIYKSNGVVEKDLWNEY